MIKKECERLHALGFACIWLHPKSKRPVGNAWQKGPRVSLADLRASYKKGMNVGVRLGRASWFGDSYLAVIDCDVKSTDKKHQREMAGKLKTLLPKLPAGTPSVISGRGNGSCHLYIRTSKLAPPSRLAKSTEIVKCKMPSAKPSPRELKDLTAEEIKAGIRLRAAWEISLMGEGQQVVLPPSIHPDSGRAYQWATGVKRNKDIPIVDLSGLIGASNPCTETDNPAQEKFNPVGYNLDRLPDETVDLIENGTGCEDRSAALFTVAMQMRRADYTDDEILSALTDPDNWLSSCAYEHTQSRSRQRAVAWVRKYTLKKAKEETDPAHDFDGLVIEDDVPELSDEETEKQTKEILKDKDWKSDIERTAEKAGRRPKPTMKNLLVILRGECGADVFKYNEFANTDEYGQNTPWGGVAGAEVTDRSVNQLKEWLTKRWRVEPARQLLDECVMAIADANRYHPVRNYLDGLVWDGKPRLDSWLKTYLNATGAKDYVSALGRKTLCAMVARIYEPGRKFDNVLILEGAQGIGKSTALRYLVGDEWFSDASINVADKDSVMTMRSKWLIEMGELTSIHRPDMETLKAFITRTTDRIRAPYGKRAENFPRQCIFIGTTNQDDYLKDDSGNRRFWPVHVGDCDFDAVRKDRDQLFAEAVYAYQLGEPLYLESAEVNALAVQEQAARVAFDGWVETIAKYMTTEERKPEKERQINIDGFTINDLFDDFGPLGKERNGRGEQMRAASALRALGYQRQRKRFDGNWKTRGYVWVSKKVGT